MASIFSVFGEILIDNTNADKSIDNTTEKAKKVAQRWAPRFRLSQKVRLPLEPQLLQELRQ